MYINILRVPCLLSTPRGHLNGLFLPVEAPDGGAVDGRQQRQVRVEVVVPTQVLQSERCKFTVSLATDKIVVIGCTMIICSLLTLPVFLYVCKQQTKRVPNKEHQTLIILAHAHEYDIDGD